MTATPDRRIPLATAPNLRSLGGLPVADGAVASGVLFRSATLAGLSDEDGKALSDLGVTRVFDLRTAGERESAPDRLPEGVENVALDVLADGSTGVVGGMRRLLETDGPDGRLPSEQAERAAREVSETLGDGRGIAMMQDTYRRLVSLGSARDAYRGFFEALTETPEYSPSLFHCTTGKDCTGWAAAVFLLALGADGDTAMQDYLQTNVDILPMVEPILDRADRSGVDSSLLRPLLTVQESFLEAALDEMRERFGSLEGYLGEGLGLGADRLDALRERFVTAG